MRTSIRTSTIPAVKKTTRASKRTVTWSEVLGCLQDDTARLWALGHFKTACFKPDDFYGSVSARKAMAEALTYAEDQMETYYPGRVRDRRAMREVRRRLELECWT